MSFDGREKEREIIESFLTNFDAAGHSMEPVLYVSGTPGTGKTALVNSIISSVDTIDTAKIIFLNCMSITGMDVLWTRLSEELIASKKVGTSKRTTSKKASSRDEIAAFLDKHVDTSWCVIRSLLFIFDTDMAFQRPCA